MPVRSSKMRPSTVASRSIENSVGKVSGTLASSTGGVIPIEYQLVKENDAWKILNIDLTVH